MLTTAALPASMRLDPVRTAVEKAVMVRLPRRLLALAPCQHVDAPLRGQACPACHGRVRASA